MKITLKGIVSQGDACRCDHEQDQGAILVGGEDLLSALDDQDLLQGTVTVTLNGIVVADGKLYVEGGWGYSEYTPMDSDVLEVGDVSLIGLLDDFVGKEVEITVEGKP